MCGIAALTITWRSLQISFQIRKLDGSDVLAMVGIIAWVVGRAATWWDWYRARAGEEIATGLSIRNGRSDPLDAQAEATDATPKPSGALGRSPLVDGAQVGGLRALPIVRRCSYQAQAVGAPG